MAAGYLIPIDREYLDLLCRSAQGSSSNGGDAEDMDDIDADKDDINSTNKPLQFVSSFLRCLYSGRYAKDQCISRSFNGFVRRLQELQGLIGSLLERCL